MTPKPPVSPSVNSPVVVPVIVPVAETPIRFPHIPSRHVAPPASAAWLRAGEADLRIDGDHNPPGQTGKSEVPGLRSRSPSAQSLRAEAFDDRMLPEAPAPSDDALRQPTEVLQPMLDQLRLRLLDFGNLLSRDYPGDQRLEAAFEVVCRSYGQLVATRR